MNDISIIAEIKKEQRRNRNRFIALAFLIALVGAMEKFL